jgi:hypothetical protein
LLPAAPRVGRQQLGVVLASPDGGTVVLDRVVVEP